MEPPKVSTITIEDLLAQHQKLSALPMHQVWAECVFLGKDIENRNRPCHKRGTIIVYACVSRSGIQDSLRFINDRPVGRSLLRGGVVLCFGALLGAIDIIDCTDNTHLDRGVGDWGMPRFPLASQQSSPLC